MKNKKIVEEQKLQDLSIVLNDGNLEMKGATVPVKWYFSRNLALNEPTHILLVDLSGAEVEESISYGGRRYLVEVEKAVKFLQFFKAGKHIMLAFAFKGLSAVAPFLAKQEKDKSLYEEPVFINLEKTGYYDYTKKTILALTIVEFTVPQEVFARKPKSKIGKLFFNYLYWPGPSNPRDECQVKKNALFFALPKLPCFIFVQLLYVVDLFLASAILLFFGYQSIGLAEIFKRIFSQDNYYNTDVCVLGLGRTKARIIYKNGVETAKRTWFSPFHLTGFFSLLGLLLLSFYHVSENPLIPGSTVTVVFFILVFAFFILKRFFNEKVLKDIFTSLFLLYVFVIGVVFLFFREIPVVKDRIEYLVVYSFLSLAIIPLFFSLRKIIVNTVWYKKYFDVVIENKTKKKEKVYSDYLLENFTVPEEKLDLKNLPDTFKTSKLKRDLTIRFWSAKADVCKPYES